MNQRGFTSYFMSLLYFIWIFIPKKFYRKTVHKQINLVQKLNYLKNKIKWDRNNLILNNVGAEHGDACISALVIHSCQRAYIISSMDSISTGRYVQNRTKNEFLKQKRTLQSESNKFQRCMYEIRMAPNRLSRAAHKIK